MKNRECSIVRDILPLYIENVISDDTKQFVDEHLSHCAECKNELELLQTDIPIKKICSEKDSGVEVIKKIGLDIKKKRVFTGILSAVISAIVVILSFAYLTAPEYLPYAESFDIFSVKDNNGSVTLSFTGEYEIYQSEQGVYNISIYNTIWNKLFNIEKKQDITVNPNGETVNTIYYVSNGGQEDKVIYGRNPINNGGVMTLPRLVLNYYFVTAILFALVLAILVVIFRKKEKVKAIIVKILFIPISYILSHIMIKGWNATSYSATRDFYLILLLVIPIYSLFYILYKKKHSKFRH
jgi:hypothetical protein